MKIAALFGVGYVVGTLSNAQLCWESLAENRQTNMGNADLKAAFRTRKHEINVSTYQARASRPRVTRVHACPQVYVRAAHSHALPEC